MSPEVELKLPQRSPRRGARERLHTGLLVATLVVTVAVGGVIAFRSVVTGTETRLNPDSLEALALRLERGGHAEAAVDIWRDYLEEAPLNRRDRAAIWFRIGTLLGEALLHEEAVAALYRSEAWFEDPELSFEIGQLIEDNLRRMGSIAALRYDLSERVGVGEADVDPVVAEIGNEQITSSDLDRLAEDLIDDELAQFEGIVPQNELAREREALLSRFANAEQRSALLSQYLAEELLYRRARSEDLDESSRMRRRIMRSERRILASALLQREVSQRVSITTSDIERYYADNRERFVVPERVLVHHIVTDSFADAERVLALARSGRDFASLAEDHSIDEASKANGGEIGWISRGEPVPALGDSIEAKAAIFAARPGEVSQSIVSSSAGYHVIMIAEREESRLPDLDELRPQLYEQLYARESQEVREVLLDELRAEYDVVIHGGALTAQPEAPAGRSE